MSVAPVRGRKDGGNRPPSSNEEIFANSLQRSSALSAEEMAILSVLLLSDGREDLFLLRTLPPEVF